MVGSPITTKSGRNAFGFDQRVRGDAVAPLLHVAEVVAGHAVQQAEFLRQRQPVDHAGRAALLVAGAAREKDAVFDLARERIPLPAVGVANAHRVDVAVVEQLGRAAADLADDVAHLVEPDFVEAELAHFGFGALADCANLAVVAGDGAQVFQKLDDVVALRFDARLDRVNGLLIGHGGSIVLESEIDIVVVRFQLAAVENDDPRIGFLDALDLFVQHHAAPA